jgi:uncharacterized protein DUF1553/uncharacterized protein DUF1549/cytochrome c
MQAMMDRAVRTVLGLLSLVALAAPAGASPPAPAGSAVEFNRDIRPILSEKCFFCHGPDEKARKRGLRLDTREGIFREREGASAVVAGKLDDSRLYEKITETSVRKRMPPTESGKTLSEKEIDLIRRWIEGGAVWQDHWSYTPPVRIEPPEIPGQPGLDPIDRFVIARAREMGLEPAPPADPVTLVRRLRFDLTGLPPAPDEVEAFEKEPGPDAYEKLVDRLLALPQFGERMALYWLDLVRYADTTGYHGDNHRDVYLYRDWVIGAFNRGLPFDRFTVEQLAGDLLPGATIEQKIASGYNRMNMTTQEGGAQAGDYVARYAADRVRNLSVVWLAATLGCSECHDHKYDPYTQRDFYSLQAFFADVKEMPIGEPGPGLPVPGEGQAAELKAMETRLGELRKDLEARAGELALARSRWEASALSEGDLKIEDWKLAGPFAAPSFAEAFKEPFEPEKELESRSPDEGKLHWTPRPEWADGAVHPLVGENSAFYLGRVIRSARARKAELSLGSDDGLKVWVNGKEALSREVNRPAAPDQEKLPVDLVEGENRILLKVVNAGGPAGFYFKVRGTDLPPEVLAAIKVPADQRTREQAEAILVHWRSVAPELKEERERIAGAEKAREAKQKEIPTTMITEAVEPRVVRILPRGNWMDTSGEVVTPAVPRRLGAVSVEGRRSNRLDLARWLTSRDNSLVARVWVNRMWKLLFGQGLAKNVDDLGSQGQPPTHPELLDTLAVDFMEGGWDTRKLLRRIVLTRSYRQDSRPSPAARERDPSNQWLSHQGRWRLDAELVRDGALAASGLLSPRIGGPSVKPYQPSGYWSYLNFPKRDWVSDHGESLYRRALYTYWQRMFLHPSLRAFDAPSREECVADRPRSNTPLQALVLLNDPIFVEAARVLAEKVIREGGTAPQERVRWAIRRVLTRSPQEGEAELLEALYKKHRTEYEADPQAGRDLIAVGEWPAPGDIEPVELAAWTSVARALLNLHETITRS